jgi:D-glycero-alpha-D-manno-heptose 1-phosphate guanylyltransferase
LDLCGPVVLVVNGDSLTLTDLAEPFSRLEAEQLDGVLVGIPVDDASRYGSLDVDGQGMLRGFREKQPGAGLINCGIYLFRHALLATMPKGQAFSIEAEFIPSALAHGARLGVVRAARTTGETAFLDIGTPQTVHQASEFIAGNRDAFPPLLDPSGRKKA